MAEDMHNPAMLETPAPPPGLLIADYFQQSTNFYGYRPHGTRDWLITYTQSGQGRFLLPDFAHIAEPGMITILAPGTPHHYTTQQAPWQFYWAHFLPRPHWTTWLHTLSQPFPGFYTLSLTDETIKNRLEQSFIQLLTDNRITINPFHEDLALNSLERVLLLCAQQAQAQTQSLDPRVTQILNYLAQNLDCQLALGELAQLVSLSPSRLSHLFKEQVGDSLAATHLKLRLRHAARLLKFTNQQINQIAHATGFQSAFHFSRQFRAHYRVNPTQYREQA